LPEFDIVLDHHSTMLFTQGRNFKLFSLSGPRRLASFSPDADAAAWAGFFEGR